MMEPKNDIGAQIDKIRADVKRCGESRVGCEELKLLCRQEVSRRKKEVGVEQIALWENWNFEYCTDGTVVFTPLGDKLREQALPSWCGSP